MPAAEPLHDRRSSLTAVRWALIGLCASLIVFSDRMAGRLGFAVLLLLAVFLGRYGNRWSARVPRTGESLGATPQPPAQPRASETDVRRREAGK